MLTPELIAFLRRRTESGLVPGPCKKRPGIEGGRVGRQLAPSDLLRNGRLTVASDNHVKRILCQRRETLGGQNNGVVAKPEI